MRLFIHFWVAENAHPTFVSAQIVAHHCAIVSRTHMYPTHAHVQPEWPEAYSAALAALGQGQEVPIPRPHPKFGLNDLQRIAERGPRFADVVLPHAEQDATISDSGAERARAYNYIPASVLGDWGYELEPDWAALPQVG